MANSGSFTGTTSNQYIISKIDWEVTSQDTTNVTSTIKVSLSFKRTNSGYSTNRYWIGNLKCGSQLEAGDGRYYSITETVWSTVQTSTFTVQHNIDGTLTVELGVVESLLKAQGSSTNYTVYKATQNVTLPTIDRTCTLSCGQFTIGSAGTINISKPDPSFTVDISVRWGDTTEAGLASGKGYYAYICKNSSATSVSWTPPIDGLCPIIPNDTAGVGSLICDTKYNGNIINSSNITFKAYVPDSVVPSITSFTATRIDNSVPASWEQYIQWKSQCELNVVGSGSQGSTIQSYSIKQGSTVLSSEASVTTSVLNTSGSITYTATLTDSRGRTASQDVSITVIEYTVPMIESILSQRCLSDGTLNDDGTYIKSQYVFTIASCSGKNTSSGTVQFRKKGTSSWSSSVSISSETPVVIAGSASIDSTYEVLYSVTDAFTTITITDIVSTAFTTMDFRKGGKGVSIGKVSEVDNLFDVALPSKFRNGLILVDSDGTEYNVLELIKRL